MPTIKRYPWSNICLFLHFNSWDTDRQDNTVSRRHSHCIEGHFHGFTVTLCKLCLNKTARSNYVFYIKVKKKIMATHAYFLLTCRIQNVIKLFLTVEPIFITYWCVLCLGACLGPYVAHAMMCVTYCLYNKGKDWSLVRILKKNVFYDLHSNSYIINNTVHNQESLHFQQLTVHRHFEFTMRV